MHTLSPVAAPGGSTNTKVWRWAVRQETMKESWKRHSITVGGPGGLVFFYKVIIKSMTHTHEKSSFLPFLHDGRSVEVKAMWGLHDKGYPFLFIM